MIASETLLPRRLGVERGLRSPSFSSRLRQSTTGLEKPAFCRGATVVASGDGDQQICVGSSSGGIMVFNYTGGKFRLSARPRPPTTAAAAYSLSDTRSSRIISTRPPWPSTQRRTPGPPPRSSPADDAFGAQRPGVRPHVRAGRVRRAAAAGGAPAHAPAHQRRRPRLDHRVGRVVVRQLREGVLLRRGAVIDAAAPTPRAPWPTWLFLPSESAPSLSLS